MVVGAPAQSYALFDWLCPGPSYRGTRTTSYAPPMRGPVMGWSPRYSTPPWGPTAPGPVMAAPAAATTCCYVPITCYRTEYRPGPVTTCQAVTCIDPCTGCPTVSYRPATSWAYRPQLVPYTTYQIVYMAPAVSASAGVAAGACQMATPSLLTAPAGTCVGAPPASRGVSPAPSTLPTAAPGASIPPALPLPGSSTSSLPGPAPASPMRGTGSPAWGSSGASPWGGLTTTPGATSAPAATPKPGRSPATGGFSPNPGGPAATPYGAQSPSSAPPVPAAQPPASTPPRTLEQQAPAPQERLTPVPDSNTGPSPGKMPSQEGRAGRTAQRPIPRAAIQTVSHRSQSGLPARSGLDTSGWEAAGH